MSFKLGDKIIVNSHNSYYYGRRGIITGEPYYYNDGNDDRYKINTEINPVLYFDESGLDLDVDATFNDKFDELLSMKSEE